MSDEIRLEGLGLKPGVIERIVTLAAAHVDGVDSICGQGLAGFVPKSSSARSVEVAVDDVGGVEVGIHLEVAYRRPLHHVAGTVQDAIAEAIRSQLGVPVASVDVYVDGVVFPG